MAKWKRSFCGLLSAFFFLFSPVQSYASTAVIALTVGTYSLKTILAACGVVGGTAALAALFGSWDDMDTYRALGAAKKLGAYAQRVYDGARDTANDTMEQMKELEASMIACVTSAWGDTVEGIKPLAADLKEFLLTCYGYGQAGKFWHLPSIPADHTWCQSDWSTLDFYPLPTTPVSLVPFVANSDAYTLFLSSYVVSDYDDVMNIQNWYYDNSKDIFGVYDAVNHVLTTYQRNAANSTYAEYSAIAYSAFIYEDGSLKYNISSSSYWKRPTQTCDPDCAGSLSFPVFGNITDAEQYVVTGNAVNTYVPGTIPFEVDSFRQDVAAGSITDTLVLPGSAELANDALTALETGYADASAADLEKILADAGVGVTITDIPADSVISAGDQAIVDAIEALPGDVADIIADSLVIDSDLAEEQLSLPAVIASKFPFCIPFDLIHLVQALAAEKEVPRFEIPIKFDYRDFHYNETFVVDMSVFDPAINIFRVMMDLLFCAGLITVTRKLIRG